MLKLALTGLCLLLAAPSGTFRPDNDLFKINGGKPLLDAHNCYPYDGKWSNRIDRALSVGLPVAIEQDVASYTDPQSGLVSIRVTHNAEASAGEPLLADHFFERVRPLVEKALREKKRQTWPLIVVHFDFKNNKPATLEAAWKVLQKYQDWLTTAPKTARDSDLAPFDWKPLIALTEENDTQEEVFYRRLKVNDRMLLFGSAHTNEKLFAGMDQKQKVYAIAHTQPDLLLTQPASNYRRWWNNSWYAVEQGGQNQAGPWDAADEERLDALVSHAHRLGYWIRFYTLDGYSAEENQGWGQTYNFGSRQAAEKRWRAASNAGVDLIATDQYEAFAAFMKKK